MSENVVKMLYLVFRRRNLLRLSDLIISCQKRTFTKSSNCLHIFVLPSRRPCLRPSIHCQRKSPQYNIPIRWRATVEQIYQKKTQLEHVLLRPDTYIGSIVPITKLMWVVSEDGQHMKRKDVTYIPGLFKLFDEILVNAADNKRNNSNMSSIDIVVDPSQNMIRIWNDGKGIPIVKHKEHKMYIPTLIFGHLLTSSNYDDTIKRVTGGRHGFGAKLCNIFSNKFIVETSSKKEGIKFMQVWTDNMSKATDPKITETDVEDSTCVTFYPDLSRFDVKTIDKDLFELFKKRAYDVAATTPGLKVVFNGETLPVTRFKDYIEMYVNNDEEEESQKFVYAVINKRWEVAVSPSHSGFQHISFVNSIYTEKGGTHVKYILDKLIKSISPLTSKKSGIGEVKQSMIKDNLFLFVNCLIENPSFDSQTKESLTLPPLKFGSRCSISSTFINKIEEIGLVDQILASTESKLLKKVDRANRKLRLGGVTKLEDAQHAGTSKGCDCTLILTEGDSAKATAVAGLSVVGRSHYGVYPLRGKLLNVRMSGIDQISKNDEIQNLKKVLGLQLTKTYATKEEFKTLRYGKVMIMADQDEDGSHVKGLIINFIHHFWPKLLETNFIVEFRTPLIKVSKGKETRKFYSHLEYQEWKQETPNWPSWKIKYYKGLGTSTSKEAKEYFSMMDHHKVDYIREGTEDDDQIEMMFGKDPNKRKEWMEKFMAEADVVNIEDQIQKYPDKSEFRKITYKDFINSEMIPFATMSINRAIPSLVDGLKVSHRKILYTCFMKHNTQNEIKVAQLAASVAAYTSYHHGETSLMQSIITLAQDFVGSNNLNLLMPIGQFGTRLEGGKDAASPRYIFTRLNPISLLAFNPKDFPLLEHVHFDDQEMEPAYFYPILPMVLVNGAFGVATGWNTSVPNYDLKDIIKNLMRLMNGEKPEHMIPAYRNFQGTIKEVNQNQFKISGNVAVVNQKTVKITELPIGVWTQKYKEKVLETLRTAGKIINYREEHTDEKVQFIVTMDKTQLEDKKHDLLTFFKLERSLTPNMVLLDETGAIRRYNDPREILEEFYKLRLKMYQKRKDYMEGLLTAEHLYLFNRMKFVEDKINGKLDIENKKVEEVSEIIRKSGFAKDPIKAWKLKNQRKEEHAEDESDDDTDQDADFAYLLNLPFYSLTLNHKEKLSRNLSAKEAELKSIQAKTVKDLWMVDLNAFMVQLEKDEKAASKGS